MVKLYQTMIENGGDLNSEQVKEVIYYMNQQSLFKYNNPDFNEALKWFSRMQWTFDKFADDIYKNYFEMLYDRYTNIKAVLEDSDTLKRCQYEQNVKGEIQTFEPGVKDIEVWLKKISRKNDDPLIVWLKDNLSEEAEYAEVQNAIVNRFQLDIGGLLDLHSGILIPLLHNEHIYRLRPDEIGRERNKVLIGTELTSQYLDELTKIVRSAQLEFAKTL